MSTEPLTVAVLMGGQASEHDISLKTGTTITSHLDRSKYHVLPIQIRRDGKWLLPDGPLSGTAPWLPAAEDDGVSASAQSSSTDAQSILPVATQHTIPTGEIVQKGIDVAIIALHGRYGEDGCIQGMLETLGIPYTGSGVLASALAMDKVRAKALVQFHGMTTPHWVVIEEPAWRDDRERILGEIEKDFGFPCVAKVPEEGSSFGMGIPENVEELAGLLDEFIAARGHMMVEEYVTGTEITGSVMGAPRGEEPIALPLIEIVPKSARFFDFDAKYTPGATDEITPARVDEDLTLRAQTMAVDAHRILGCGTISRTDMIVRDREIFYLETNTIPGMTETSLLPQAAAAVGISFSDILDRQIQLALIL
jgi:D-alanine-D-alanine ligase